MWKKSNSKTWRHNSGVIVSNESYISHGVCFKHVNTYKNEDDFSKGVLMDSFESVVDAKKSIKELK